MPTISTLQRWAERYSTKLGVTRTVKVVKSKECPRKSSNRIGKTHCHTELGVVCWGNEAQHKAHKWWIENRGWRALIAHEVCHLKVRDHTSPYFARWMARLGFKEERRQAAVAGLLRHRHTWGQYYTTNHDGSVSRSCTLCSKSQTGTVTWR